MAETIIGSGTVSNRTYAERGAACISERRAIEMIASGASQTPYMALAASPAVGERARPVDPRFLQGFLWGSATAGHQVEGNNVNVDIWLAEHVTPTAFVEPSGDAANSFALWRTVLADIARRNSL